ncbi:MAG: hypothetical protein IT260_01735 [Saprospiraceae bacterium]|nr:hypothetical protein [Saprospiraceae bacterium]
MDQNRRILPQALGLGIKLGLMVFVQFLLLSFLNLWNPKRVPHPYWHDALAVLIFSVFLTVFSGGLFYWYEEKYVPRRRRNIMRHPHLQTLAQLGFQSNDEYWEGQYRGRQCRVIWLANSVEGGLGTPLCLEFFCEKMTPARRQEIERAFAGEKVLVGPVVVAPFCSILFRVPPPEAIRRQLDLGVGILETYGLQSRRFSDIAPEE